MFAVSVDFWNINALQSFVIGFMTIYLRYWFLLVSMALFALQAMAQVSPCPPSTETEVIIKQREQRILQLKQQFVGTNISTAPTYIPIKAHIVRKSDGSGGLSLVDLNKAISQINSMYINAGIQFYLCGSSPDYINNSGYYDFNSSQETAFCASNDVNNAINIYFLNSISFAGLAVSGYAYFPSFISETNRIFIQNTAATDSRTLPHEMGHYFNLLHTFQGSTSSNLTDRELVTRLTTANANCTLKGDLLCDTPADPYGRPADSTQSIGCSYQGNARDAQGQLYTPSLGNIMSYNPIVCGNSFTGGQYARIADGLLLRIDPNNQYALNCSATVTGANVPSGLTGAVNGFGLALTFTDNSFNETGFIIERSTTSATTGFVTVAGLAPNTTAFTDQSTTAFTTYYYRVKASNSPTQYSNVFQITTSLNYCIPVYANSCSTVGVFIDDFVLQEGSTKIINNIATGCSSANFGDFTANPYNVEAGKTYTFIARAVTGGTGTFFDQHITIWIDYNRNGIFDGSEIIYQSDDVSIPHMNPTATASFSIPSTTSVGGLRMRIRTGFGSFGQVTDPCASITFGEAEDYFLNVATTANISAGTVSPTMACAGQPISVAFTSNITANNATYQVQLSDINGANFANIPTFGTGSPLSATIPTSTVASSGYRVRIISTNPNGVSPVSPTFSVNPIPSAPTVTTPINYTQNQSATPLSATGSTLSWYAAATGGFGSSVVPTPNTSVIGTTDYYVTQTILNCESARANIKVNVTASSNIVACLNVKMLLEGAYMSGGQMSTDLNTQGLLPGQTVTDPFGTNTPAGQPYNVAPWSYTGTEAVVQPYNATVVDWVLLSLRTNPDDKTTTVYRTAALLNKNGTVTTIAACPTLSATQQYYVAIDHRNHIGAVSHVPVSIISNQITYDFRLQNSYIPVGGFGYGQQKIGTTYLLYAGDCLKATNPVIDVSDNNKWRQNNGVFSKYITTDMNLDGAIDTADRLLWRKNNGKFSGVDF
jgi:GEVED domain/Pregnancy-associated plasma protein-A/Ig-like domain CHU_C associated